MTHDERHWANSPKLKGLVKAKIVTRWTVVDGAGDDFKTFNTLEEAEECARSMEGFDVVERVPAAVDPDYPDGKQPEPPQWFREFGAEYAVPGEIFTNPLLEDESWHNDTCPRFQVKGYGYLITLWVEHPDKSQRQFFTGEEPEDEACKRFCMYFDDAFLEHEKPENVAAFNALITKGRKVGTICATDDVQEVLKALADFLA